MFGTFLRISFWHARARVPCVCLCVRARAHACLRVEGTGGLLFLMCLCTAWRCLVVVARFVCYFNVFAVVLFRQPVEALGQILGHGVAPGHVSVCVAAFNCLEVTHRYEAVDVFIHGLVFVCVRSKDRRCCARVTPAKSPWRPLAQSVVRALKGLACRAKPSRAR